MDKVFRFKQFSVSNSRAGLKVGTDAVLLGAAVGLPEQSHDTDTCGNTTLRVLDIGTGTGVIALIVAQRLAAAQVADFHIEGIDIDADAAGEATENFAASPWSDHLTSRHASLQEFADAQWVPCNCDSALQLKSALRYDLILSNPPYYDESLKAPDPQRSTARHTESLSYREVITFAGDFLAPQGRLALILPKEEETRLLRFAASFGFKPVRILNIRTTPAKSPKRIIAEFARAQHCANPRGITEYLTIQDAGEFTAEYKSLTAEFYLNF